MRVLLANPPCRIPVDQDCERYFVRAGSRWPFSTLKEINKPPEYVPFPFYLAYSAALLEQEDYEVFILDAVALNLSREEFIKRALDIAPHVLLFETATPTIKHDLEMVERLKRGLKVDTVLAGAHVSVFPYEVMQESEHVDFILTGEYEINFLKLVNLLSQDRRDMIDELDGVCFRKDSKIIHRANKGNLELSKLPYPARHLFPSNDNNDLSLYWDGFCQFRPAIQMQASRGCPFRCNFCLWNQVIYREGKYRTFSATRVVDEMEDCIKKYRAKEVYFDDDSFTVNKNHVLDICREIKKRGLKVRWSCMADAIATDEEMIGVMKDAGCIGMKFGVESADEEMLRKIGKPLSLKKVKNFAGWCANKRIKTHATFTFGLLGETKESMRNTLDFAKNLDVDSVQFSITTPFPGTRYYDYLAGNDLLIANNWQDYDGANNVVVKYENLSSPELEGFHGQASRLWLRCKLRDLRWIIRQIQNLIRITRGQGIAAPLARIKRAIKLIRR